MLPVRVDTDARGRMHSITELGDRTAGFSVDGDLAIKLLLI